MNFVKGDPFEGSDPVPREDLDASPTKGRTSAERGATVKFDVFGRIPITKSLVFKLSGSLTVPFGCAHIYPKISGSGLPS